MSETPLVSDERVRELAQEAQIPWPGTLPEGVTLTRPEQVEAAIRTAVREAGEAAARLCNQRWTAEAQICASFIRKRL